MKNGPMPEKQKEHLRKVWKKKKRESVQEETPSPFLDMVDTTFMGFILMPYTVTFRTHSGEFANE